MNQKSSILIVDDSDVIRQLLKNIVSSYNFDVITCQDGLEGIQKAIEHKPSLIFLDLLMPNFDGLKMLQVIKIIDNLKHIPVIVISGNTTKTNVMSAIEAGADRVISKPLQPDMIVKTINELFSKDLREKPKDSKPIISNDKEFINHLCRIFLDSFPLKRQKMSEGLEAKKKELISPFIHELKGTSGTIGYPVIGVLCFDIEKALEEKSIDWSVVNLKCQQIFYIVDKIKYPKPVAGA